MGVLTQSKYPGKPLRTAAVIAVYCMLIASVSVSRTALAVELGQIDNFEDGSTQGWRKGAQSNNRPTNISTGGPAGADDNYLETISTGGSGSDSRQIIFNRSQWTGDYPAAGVTEIEMQFRNAGNSALHMRIALKGGGGSGSWFSSTQAFNVPADGNWYAALFSISETDLTQVQGSLTYAEALANVTEMRILSRQSAPDFVGDAVASTLGIDNIQAVGVQDTDGDGVPDDEDAFPNDPTEWDDTDGDGIGNNADEDDDNDLMPDDFEVANNLDPLDPADALADADGDGFSNRAEFFAGTDVNDPQSNPSVNSGAVNVILNLLLDNDT